MQQKVREVHGLNVSRDLVYAVMGEADPEGLQSRGGIGKPKRPRRTNAFVSRGSNSTMSLDGHDKLCGYQKSMFPLCIYGGLDVYSGRVNFLKVWTTNNNPLVIGRFYFEYLFKARVLPQTLRLDRGTETDVMATIHCFLRGDLHNALDAIIYGPSTQNKIERWWRDLLERMERFFKEQLKCLVESGDYDSSDQNDRDLLAYVYIPIIQKELDIFRECVWNKHRTRKQKGKELPAGIPEHIFHFPEKYGGEQCGIDITEEQLLEVSELSNVLEDNDDYLRPAVGEECKKNLPQIHEINPSDAKEAYLYLKSHVDVNIFQDTIQTRFIKIVF
ncbi:uncharacterized protein LOC124455590 [Xenia sp. Carnegie-2017]|uniref:uncharacterized protein LOC124455590 n=1 Tax=Xenia sp. Carnegie-2017 TaxID=2897299 RepID=UPI001F033849|nr:uncharacterized protein LOC124455590 [Xenia sp. Carnegie-2017]